MNTSEIKDPPVGSVISDAASELDDDETSTTTNEYEDNFDLPLKSKFLQSKNFSDLSDGWDQLDENLKKVRFDVYDDNEGKTKSNKSKAAMEELLNNANEINDFVVQNMDKINTFDSESLNSKGLYKIMSDTANTTRTESLSNFELSDIDIDGNYKLDAINSSSVDNIESSIDNVLSGPILASSSREGLISNDNLSASDNDHNICSDISIKAEKNDNILLELNEEACRYNASKLMASQKELEKDTKCGAAPLLYDPDNLSPEAVELEGYYAIKNFKEAIQLISKLSEDEQMMSDKVQDQNRYSSFVMKNTPSLSYEEFIDRIQSKCMFGPIVYESATYLLEILLLQREDMESTIKLKHKLDASEIHRMIISTIRVGTKLIEDHVHSHQYFCKVCGISKRLLTKLEVALLMLLKNEGLMINSEKLAASSKILEEIRSYVN